MYNNKSWLSGVFASGITSTAILGVALVSSGGVASSNAETKPTPKNNYAVANTTPTSNNSKIFDDAAERIKKQVKTEEISRSIARQKLLNEVHVYIVDGGTGKSFTVKKGTKLSELLKTAKITLNSNDKISGNVNSVLTDNQVVSINRITNKSYEKTITTKYSTVTETATDNCVDGEVTTTPGKEGSTVETWLKIFDNGRLVSDSKKSSVVKTAPVNTVKNTCKRPKVTPTIVAAETETMASTGGAAAAATTPTAIQTPLPAPTFITSGSHSDWMRAAGISESDFAATEFIINHESSWNPNATNPSSGACGLVQALPCSKLGASWNDPVTSLKWFKNYAISRYGSISGAQAFWRAHNWY